MENRIKHVKISLYIEILLGIILAIGLPIFIMVLGTNADQPTEMNPIFGALLALFMVALPFIVLPILAIKELDAFAEKGGLFLNYLNTCTVIAFTFFPLAFWQLYMFKQLKKSIAPETAKS